MRPKGVLIGNLEVYHNSKLAESTEAFARYYQLPVYAFINGNVTLLKTYKKIIYWNSRCVTMIKQNSGKLYSVLWVYIFGT